MALLDSILSRVLGKHHNISEIDRLFAELSEAQERNKASCQAVIAACRKDRAASIRLRRQLRTTNRRMRAELEAERAA
jgi:hypothetical protein